MSDEKSYEKENDFEKEEGDEKKIVDELQTPSYKEDDGERGQNFTPSPKRLAQIKKKQIKKHFVKERETNWVNNFQLMCSKDNNRFHKSLREFFDKPRDYDVRGTRKTSPTPYELRNKFQTENKLFKTTASNMFTQEERSSSSKMGMVGTGFYKKDKPLFKNRFNKFVSDYGVETNVSIPFLRGGGVRTRSPEGVKQQRQEIQWNNRTYAISMHNQALHSSYRVLFEKNPKFKF